jgi:hypothetical protein
VPASPPDPLPEPPHPTNANAVTAITPSIHLMTARSRLRYIERPPMSSSGNGHTRAICIPDRSVDICAADIAPTVIVVLCGVLPDRLAGAKLRL